MPLFYFTLKDGFNSIPDCEGAVFPGNEVCGNGTDENCNGDADDSLAAFNWAVRVDVLTGPKLDEMYALFGDEMTKGLEPLIRTFAPGHFKKGILVHKDGVAAAMKEFSNTIVPLLRRDVEGMIPKKIFAPLVFEIDTPANGIGDTAALFENFLLHEVFVFAFYGTYGVPGDIVNGDGHRLPVQGL